MVFYLVFLAKKLSQLKMIIKLAQTKSLIYKNEFILNLKYKLKVYNRGFYLNGLNGLE